MTSTSPSQKIHKTPLLTHTFPQKEKLNSKPFYTFLNKLLMTCLNIITVRVELSSFTLDVF
jgi:hypothetical protein